MKRERLFTQSRHNQMTSPSFWTSFLFTSLATATAGELYLGLNLIEKFYMGLNLIENNDVTIFFLGAHEIPTVAKETMSGNIKAHEKPD